MYKDVVPNNNLTIQVLLVKVAFIFTSIRMKFLSEVSELQAAFAYQSEVLKDYQKQLESLQSTNEYLTHYIRSLPPPMPQTVSLAMPDKFDGSADKCRGFIRQVEIYFDHQKDKFASDNQKFAFLMTLLMGRVITWAAAVWESDSIICTSYEYFKQKLHDVFVYPAGGRYISTQLLSMSQGNHLAADYAVEYRTLAAQSGWNDVSLKAVFQRSLTQELQAELACKGKTSTFSEFVNLAIRIDNLMRNAPKRIPAYGSLSSISTLAQSHSVPLATNQEPMQLGLSRLSEEERVRRRRHNLCFYCGEVGHRRLKCPHKTRTFPNPPPRVNIDQFFLLPFKALTIPVQLLIIGFSLCFGCRLD
uniref:CCHC-type domain-containing protein n=1 Tax=Sinocyclocheilus grahami TaxID=75366 RepID=A0A672NT97_SINGR